ncbi:glucose-1-phosphate thymidylyltransferase [Streptomyces sp. CS014]|uniref:glucose-1-phosphate thymidylyltransferase n=1 Tax=Streptomyces sp. CS014 TaxID=2162707 RepID=UPI000D517AB2|nr:glucose-1-phosphate thymidylyltransferase [Streptomyces sp. CS014]PVD02954.1 glucose-1-phosphate thymidylyltransferase [Streptomyces sp. CS014]
MKALVLAGGIGSRLFPITHTGAKQLIPVANKPVLFYVIETLVDAGVTDIGIVVGGTQAQVREAVGDGSAMGARVTYIYQEEPLGLAHAVLIARDFLGDEDFVMYLGDNFIVGGIDALLRKFHAEGPAAEILLTRVDNPTDFGVAELDAGGQVVRLEEKPKNPASHLAVIGVYLFTPAVHEAIDAIKPSPRGELEIVEAIQWLVNNGYPVGSATVDGYWKDTGTVSDMLEVNRSVLETLEPCTDGKVDEESEIIGRVRIERGAVVSQSRIVGPAVIGAGTVVRSSYIGPSTSIAEDCVIDTSQIEFSIVLNGAAIEGVGPIEGSLIGREAHLTRSCLTPRASHRFLIGDHCKVQVAP